MNKKLSILSIISALAISVYACDSGDDNDTTCDANYKTSCMDSKYLMTCESGKVVAKPCGENASCETNASGQGQCISATECSVSQPCTGANMVCNAEGKCVPAEPECSATNPCTDPNKICSTDGKCVDKGAEPECTAINPCTDPNKVCNAMGQCVDKSAEPECSATKPCIDPNKTCSAEGTCVDKAPEPECSLNKPCTDVNKECNAEGKCVDKTPEPECSGVKPCASGKECNAEGKCVDTTAKTCTNGGDCETGQICDNGVCRPGTSCSYTHACPDKKVCRNGACIDDTISTCNSTTPCADSGMKCVAGKCVKCSCQNDETCTVDGKCIKTNESTAKSMKTGDPCTYSKDFSFCEDNRLFTCSSSGSNPYQVGVRDCGAQICTNSPSDGINCYEPCENEGDFYGECIGLYNSMGGYNEYAAFKTVCMKDSFGRLFYSYADENPYCPGTCTNGVCDYVSKEIGTSCYEGTYQDKCDGDWLLFCDQTDSKYAGNVGGDYCPGAYSSDYFCGVDADGKAQCITKCDKEGEESNRCITASDKLEYSDSIVCKKTKDGSLAWFMTSYKPCTTGCDSATGKCK